MKTTTHILIALVLGILASCGGGGGSHNAMTDVMGDITTVLKDVKDADSAEAAKTKLQPLMERMQKLTKEAASADPAEATAMDADDAKKYAEITTAYSTEFSRVLGNEELAKVLGGVLSGTEK